MNNNKIKVTCDRCGKVIDGIWEQNGKYQYTAGFYNVKDAFWKKFANKGEKIIATQGNKTVFSAYPISNLKTQLADYFSFESTKLLSIHDNFSKIDVIIEPKNSSKHKFIYLKKEY